MTEKTGHQQEPEARSAYTHWACAHPKRHGGHLGGTRLSNGAILDGMFGVWCEMPECPEYRRVFVAHVRDANP